MPDEIEEMFLGIWSRRRRPPEILTSWVDNDWSKGRSRYLTFLVRVNDVDVIDKAIDFQSKLAAFPCIDLFPKHYFHMTVKGVGFLTQSKQHSDDLLKVDVEKVVCQTKDILKSFTQFEVSLINLNYFSEVICIEVYDNNQIREMNRALLEVSEITRMDVDYPRFLPHFSIAQFKNDERFDELIDYLEEHRKMQFGKLNVDAIELVIAHLPKYGRYPRLETLCEFRLS
ncbi:MAG: 2'-5' RNA ligase family protein [Candidatus Bathyarchaeota archaeon]|nr:2'-5' RNA ligase family protein [Candidatus Bathyarchaeota archaeon]